MTGNPYLQFSNFVLQAWHFLCERGRRSETETETENRESPKSQWWSDSVSPAGKLNSPTLSSSPSPAFPSILLGLPPTHCSVETLLYHSGTRQSEETLHQHRRLLAHTMEAQLLYACSVGDHSLARKILDEASFLSFDLNFQEVLPSIAFGC